MRKKFTTTLDEEIIKKIKIQAVKENTDVSKSICTNTWDEEIIKKIKIQAVKEKTDVSKLLEKLIEK